MKPLDEILIGIWGDILHGEPLPITEAYVEVTPDGTKHCQNSWHTTAVEAHWIPFQNRSWEFSHQLENDALRKIAKV